MRVSSVAWAFGSLDLVEFVTAETAKVTHNHPEGVKGAQATVGCVYLARHGAEDSDIAWYTRERFGYGLDFELDDVRGSFEFDESCQGAVPFALKAFLEADSFERTARKAVSLGGDSDTTLAAIACSVAHARYGVPADSRTSRRHAPVPPRTGRSPSPARSPPLPTRALCSRPVARPPRPRRAGSPRRRPPCTP